MLERAAVSCNDVGDRDGVRAAVHAIIDAMTSLMLNDAIAAISRFIARNQADPTKAFTRFQIGRAHV